MKKLYAIILMLIVLQVYSQDKQPTESESSSISLYGAMNYTRIPYDSFFNSASNYGVGGQVGANVALLNYGKFSYGLSSNLAFQSGQLERHKDNLNYQINQRLYSLLFTGYAKYEGFKYIRPKLGISFSIYMAKVYIYKIFQGQNVIYTNQSDGGLLHAASFGFYTGFEVPVSKKVSLDMSANFLYDSLFKNEYGNNYLSVFSMGVLYKL